MKNETTEQDDFVQHVQGKALSKLNQIKREETDLCAQIGRIQTRREELVSQAAELNSFLKQFALLAQDDSEHQKAAVSATTPDKSDGKKMVLSVVPEAKQPKDTQDEALSPRQKIIAACASYLSLSSKRMKREELFDMLVADGFEIPGRRSGNYLSGLLSSQRDTFAPHRTLGWTLQSRVANE